MNTFKNVIKSYLDKRAQEDSLFAEAYSKPDKSIEECCNYILSEVRKKAKNGVSAMTDDTVFCLAVHYYDEADIKVDKSVCAQVVVTGEYAPVESDVVTESAKVKKVNKHPKVAKSRESKKDPFEERQLSLFGF